ncbi:MAG: protein kinase [Polyangiaceae bacterium]|nr:protein kinase [Polyangiaceae bacterium]
MPVKCASCGSSQPPEARVCGVCGTALPVAQTVDDVEPIGAERNRTVPEAPVSAAINPAHLAPPIKPAQSAQNAAKSYLAAGTVIDGKYSIVRMLGQGGMGVVYLARDIHTQLDVVLKSVRTELAHRADVRARTLAEGRVLGQIDHPNVVHLKAVVVDDKSLWLVMQYIEGESLERTIDRANDEKKPIPIAEVLRVFRQVVSGIAAAHAEGIIHRDLKPANVLIRRKDQVAKVTDFGIAKVENESDTGRVQTRGVIGSIWYMSPEQVTGRRDLDKRVDIYALGILLFQMLTGRVPFDAESDYEVMRAQAEAPLPLARSLRADVPLTLDHLLQKLCAKKREDRFQTCDEVLAALAPIEAEVSGAHPAFAKSTPPPALTTAPAQTSPPSATLSTQANQNDRATEPERKGSPPSKDVTTPPVASTKSGSESTTATRQPAKRRVGLWITLGLVLAATGSVTTLIVTGVLPAPDKWLALATGSGSSAPTTTSPSRPTASATVTASTSAGAPPANTAPPPPTASAPAHPFDRVVGTWVGGGNRELEAIRVGDVVEFRVKNATQFAPADYEVGDARFVLRTLPEKDVEFAVEDRLRPDPPLAYPYDRGRARSTCQDVRTEVGGTALRATLDGTRLSVELIKIEPGAKNFLLEGKKTVSCLGLSKLKASKIVSILTKK